MVTRILVEEGTAEGTIVSEVPLAAATVVATCIKKEDIKSEDTTDDDGEEDKLSTAVTAAIATPLENDSNNDRKRKADTLDVLVEDDPVTAEIVQDNDITENDPLIHFKRISILPSSISDVIRLMDKLQPNMQYYKRQQDSRGECSKIRGKLRKYANANKDKMGVSHWIQTNKWKPPDEETLSALMVIIRDMIDKSWPL